LNTFDLADEIVFKSFKVLIVPIIEFWPANLADSEEEEVMAPSDEEKFELVKASLLRGVQCRATDPIYMEYLFEGDPETQAEVTAVRLNAEAQACRAVADAAEKIAQIVSRKKKT
jgi:hypothetical protein